MEMFYYEFVIVGVVMIALIFISIVLPLWLRSRGWVSAAHTRDDMSVNGPDNGEMAS